jgi:hypothetical protein
MHKVWKQLRVRGARPIIDNDEPAYVWVEAEPSVDYLGRMVKSKKRSACRESKAEARKKQSTPLEQIVWLRPS